MRKFWGKDKHKGILTPAEHERLAEAIGRARTGVSDAADILGGINNRPALMDHQRRAWRADDVLARLMEGLVHAEGGSISERFDLWSVYMRHNKDRHDGWRARRAAADRP